MTRRTARFTRRLSERQLLHDIRLAVSAECPDVVLWRNSAGVGTHTTSGQTQRFGLVVGASDLVGILTVGDIGVALFVEIKSATGRLTPEQVLFRNLVVRRGAVYVLARSVEEALGEIAAARRRLARVVLRA